MIKHQKPSLTVFADASVNHQKKVAGWGGWARGDKRRSVFPGGRLDHNRRIHVVELWALALCLIELKGNGYLTDQDNAIILQSDCLIALNVINKAMANATPAKPKPGDATIGEAKLVKPYEAEPVKIIKDLLGKCGVVYLRHVKSHQNGSHSRSWVNEACDQRAKQEMRSQLTEVREAAQ